MCLNNNYVWPTSVTFNLWPKTPGSSMCAAEMSRGPLLEPFPDTEPVKTLLLSLDRHLRFNLMYWFNSLNKDAMSYESSYPLFCKTLFFLRQKALIIKHNASGHKQYEWRAVLFSSTHANTRRNGTGSWRSYSSWWTAQSINTQTGPINELQVFVLQQHSKLYRLFLHLIFILKS